MEELKEMNLEGSEQGIPGKGNKSSDKKVTMSETHKVNEWCISERKLTRFKWRKFEK